MPSIFFYFFPAVPTKNECFSRQWTCIWILRQGNIATCWGIKYIGHFQRQSMAFRKGLVLRKNWISFFLVHMYYTRLSLFLMWSLTFVVIRVPGFLIECADFVNRIAWKLVSEVLLNCTWILLREKMWFFHMSKMEKNPKNKWKTHHTVKIRPKTLIGSSWWFFMYCLPSSPHEGKVFRV